jgi:hypothetical protein
MATHYGIPLRVVWHIPDRSRTTADGCGPKQVPCKPEAWLEIIDVPDGHSRNNPLGGAGLSGRTRQIKVARSPHLPHTKGRIE